MLFCAAHLRRTGSRVPADRVIDDEAFCRACFDGEPISPVQKLRRQSKSRRKNLQNLSHLPANPRPPRDSNRLRADPSLESRRVHEPKRAPTKCVLDKFHLGGIVDAFRNTPDRPPAVELPGLDADQTESPGVLNDGIPESHRLTALETKLLSALQDVLLHQDRLLEVFQKYRIPTTGRKKKAATARRESRSQRTWQIPLQPTPIVRQA